MNRDGKKTISETEYYGKKTISETEYNLDKRKKLRRGQTFPGAETLSLLQKTLKQTRQAIKIIYK